MDDMRCWNAWRHVSGAAGVTAGPGARRDPGQRARALLSCTGGQLPLPSILALIVLVAPSAPQDVCVFESESVGTVLLLDGEGSGAGGRRHMQQHWEQQQRRQELQWRLHERRRRRQRQ